MFVLYLVTFKLKIKLTNPHMFTLLCYFAECQISLYTDVDVCDWSILRSR